MPQCPAQFWQGLVLIPVAQQQFRRSHRPGCHDDFFCPEHTPALPIQISRADFITAASQRANRPHMMKRANLGSGTLSRCQIIQIQGVLGLHRAAQIAVTAMGAGPLLFALIIGPLLAVPRIIGIIKITGPVWIKGDRLGHNHKPFTGPGCLSGLFHQMRARRPLVFRQGLYVEHHPGGVVVRLQGRVVNGFRPAVIECLRLCLDTDVGIDQ